MDRIRLQIGAVDLRARKVVHDDGAVVAISAREAELLRWLAERPGQTVDRETLEAEVLGQRGAVVSRALDALILRLRNKIEADPAEPRHLLTIRSEGYRFEPADPVRTVWVAIGLDPGGSDEPIARAGGVLVAREGDERLVSFATAAPAARFCLARVDAGARGALGSEPSRVRRVLAVAIAGQALFERRLYDEVAAATGIREREWRALGTVRLGRDGVREELFATGTASPDLRPADGNLVLSAASLIGRAVERDRLVERLRNHRLVTLTGTGGVGKTRLALELGRLWREDGAGAWFCDLSAAGGLEDVRSAIAGALGIPAHGRVDLPRALAALDGDLVVLDNAEHVIPALREALSRVEGQVRLLVTSRERLSVAGEQVVELGRLSTDDGIALFGERARAIGVEDSDPEAVRGIVECVEGLPLAIELAAMRTELLAPAVLLARLAHRLAEVGSDGARGPRHADLGTMVRWSWDLLSPDEREVLTVCAVFAGSFRMEDVEAVAERPVVDALQALRRKGLLQASPSAGSRRWAPYAAVRAFVREEVDPATLAAVGDRHARWFARWGAPDLEDRLSSPEGPALLAHLTEDVPDLLAAMAHALPRDPPVAVDAFVGAALSAFHQGPEEWVETWALAVLPFARDPVLVQRRRWTPSMPPAAAREVDDALTGSRCPRAMALRIRLAWQLGERERCRGMADEVIARAREVGDEVALLRALAWAGASTGGLGDGFLPRTREALDLARRRGDRNEEVSVRLRLALGACDTGDLDRALEEVRAGAALAVGSSTRFRLNAKTVQGFVHLQRLEVDALPIVEEGLAEARRCGDLAAVLQSLRDLGIGRALFVGTGAALDCYVEAAREVEARGILAYLQEGLGRIAEIALAEGRWEEAIDVASRALERDTTHALWRIRAVARSRRGEWAAALDDFEQAIARASRRPIDLVRALAERGLAKARTGDAEGGRADLARAEAVMAPRLPGLVLERRLYRAAFASAVGDPAAADLRAEARAGLEALGMPPESLFGRWLASLGA